MKWTMIAFCVVISSCRNYLSVKEVEPKLQQYFSSNLKSINSTTILDSFRIIKFDTITGKDRLIMKINQLSDSARYYVQMTKEQNGAASANLKLMKQTRDIDSALYKRYQHDFDSSVNMARHYGERGSEVIYTQNSLLRIAQKADTVKPVDYQAFCLIQTKKNDGSIQRDTVNVFIIPKMDIIRKEDYYARLHD